MRYLLLMLAGVNANLAWANPCPNNREDRTWVRLQVNPDGVTFNLENRTRLHALMTTTYAYAEHRYRGFCYVTPQNVDEANALARAALAQPAAKTTNGVSARNIFNENPYVLAEIKVTREQKVTTLSDTEERIEIHLSNPRLQHLLDDCRQKQEAARAAKRDLILIPRADQLNLPACEIAP